MLARIANRVYADFLMGSRLDVYRLFLESAPLPDAPTHCASALGASAAEDRR